MGVSMTRRAPKWSRNPRVTLKAPPYTPMSSPMRNTRSSRSISSNRASLMASSSVTSSRRRVLVRCSGLKSDNAPRFEMRTLRAGRFWRSSRPRRGNGDVGVDLIEGGDAVRQGFLDGLVGGLASHVARPLGQAVELVAPDPSLVEQPPMKLRDGQPLKIADGSE